MREVTAEKDYEKMGTSRKICLVCNSGGHLLQLYRLKEWWMSYECFWVSFKKPDAVSLLKYEKVCWIYHSTARSVGNSLLNAFLAFRILLKEQPGIIVSNGAGVAVPFFYVGKLLGCKLIYVEVYDRIDSPTLTGKLVYPITDVFVLQWEEQRRFYPKGVILGQVL